jgi:glutathione S-transferase
MELTLYGDSGFESPWVFHAMVALEELGVRYKLETRKLPLSTDEKFRLQEKAVLGKVPCLAHGAFWLTESAAISEYLSETFAPPAHPRIMPADPQQRARARQVMSWLRTSLFGLREDRPTSSVFQRPINKPLGEKGRADATELVRVAEQLIAPGKTTLFDEWCMADADLALALMRLIANSDTSMTQRLIDYGLAQWGRKSVRRYLAYIPTTP